MIVARPENPPGFPPRACEKHREGGKAMAEEFQVRGEIFAMKEIPEENRKAVLEKTRDLFGPWVEEESIRRTIPSLFPIYTDQNGAASPVLQGGEG
jgi:hypothetical protein